MHAEHTLGDPVDALLLCGAPLTFAEGNHPILGLLLRAGSNVVAGIAAVEALDALELYLGAMWGQPRCVRSASQREGWGA